jgi:hypothetical protein
MVGAVIGFPVARIPSYVTAIDGTSYYSMAKQPKSGLGRLLLRFVDHTKLDTHTHIYTYTR